MILFEKDFAEQGAIVDFQTNNLSFLKMSQLLEKMGIKNNKFFLAIRDRELLGRDPHNLNDNSLELRQRVAIESKINPWYFYRAVVRISASGTSGIPYKLNRANLALMWCFYNSINSFLVMPRQIGKSVGCMSIMCHYLYVLGYNVKAGEFCKGHQLQNENVERLKRIRDALPKYMLSTSVNDINNKEGLFYNFLQNGMMTFVAQTEKKAAGDQARGQSLAMQHWDEIAYYDNINLSYPAAIAGMDTAGELAMANGIPSAIILTTTAGDIDDPRGRWCYRMACDAMRFTERLYDTPSKGDLMEILRTNSKNLYFYLEYSYKQLGKSEEWFEKVTRGKDINVIRKDYLNEWLAGSSSSVVPKELLTKIKASRKDPVSVTTADGIFIRWYDDPEKLKRDPLLRNRPYVIGSDTSDNVGRDFTTMCMVDPYDLHIVCTFRCNTTNLLYVARMILRFLKDFPRSIFIPERNKNGAVFLDFIFADMKRDVFNPLTRIFNKYFQEYTSDTDVNGLDYNDGRVRKMFGYSTTAASGSREFLYSSVLMTALELVGDRLNDSSIIDEVSGLTMKNGRVDHSDAGHDDLLIAWLLCCYFILFGSNHHLYGIRSDEFMCQVKKGGDLIDADEKKRILLAQRQIAELKGRLSRKDLNPVIRAAYERELNKLIGSTGDVEIMDDSLRPLDQVSADATQVARRMSSADLTTYMGFV